MRKIITISGIGRLANTSPENCRYYMTKRTDYPNAIGIVMIEGRRAKAYYEDEWIKYLAKRPFEHAQAKRKRKEAEDFEQPHSLKRQAIM